MSMGESESLRRAFKEHPESVGESYLGHAKQANKIGWLMIGTGLCCLVHAVFPFLFTRTASQRIRYLGMVAKKRRPGAHLEA